MLFKSLVVDLVEMYLVASQNTDALFLSPNHTPLPKEAEVDLIITYLVDLSRPTRTTGKQRSSRHYLRLQAVKTATPCSDMRWGNSPSDERPSSIVTIAGELSSLAERVSFERAQSPLLEFVIVAFGVSLLAQGLSDWWQ